MKSKIDPEIMKILVPGAVLEPSGDPLGRLGALFNDLVEIFGEDGPKMDARWAKLAASCAQDGS